jgi:hypothetical protein
MNVFVQDRNDVGETEAAIVDIHNAGPVICQFELTNDGVNSLNYRFQEYVSGTWTDMDDSGTDLYNTLLAGESLSINIESAYARVRLVGNASGGTVADFTVTRLYARASGGALPLLSL